MKKLLFLALLSTSAFFAPISADWFNLNNNSCCASDSKVYGGFIGGANFLHTTRKHDSGSQFDTGYNIGGLIGYQWLYGIRGEFEIIYRHNNLKSFLLTDFDGSRTRIHTGGNFQSTSYMINALYDFKIACWPVTPYVGIGIGYQQTKFDVEHFVVHLDGHKNGFAWQLITGIAYNYNDNIEIDLDYHFNAGPREHIYNNSLSLIAKYKF